MRIAAIWIVSNSDMIVPIVMIKRYQYGRFIRTLWLILFPCNLAFAGLVWAIWPESKGGWFWAVEAVILLHVLYALWSMLSTFGEVTLSAQEVTIKHWGRTKRLPYETIRSVSRGQTALIIKTETRSIFLERHLDDVHDLIGELQHRAPELRVDRRILLRRPLPQTINGRWQALMFSLGISLLCLSVGSGIIWSSLDETGIRFVLMIFVGLWPLLVSGLFLYLSLFFTWQLTLLPDKIAIRFPFHKQELTLEDLLSVRLITSTNNRSPEPTVVLELKLANGRSLRISQPEMPIPLMQLLEMLVYHYQLPLTYEKKISTVHHTEFGAGSRRPFTHYLSGESQVMVQSIEDICHWLQQCEYVRDIELFDQRDVWQHPGEFEALQKGDCEDHALWAWRKLKELNIPAEFVVGRAQWSETSNGAHAWIAYQENGREYILESTHKRQLIYPLEAIQERYHPWYSIDQGLKTYRYSPIASRNGATKQN